MHIYRKQKLKAKITEMKGKWYLNSAIDTTVEGVTVESVGAAAVAEVEAGRVVEVVGAVVPGRQS